VACLFGLPVWTCWAVARGVTTRAPNTRPRAHTNTSRRDDLRLINPYNPALSAAWMLQRAMTAARAPGEAAPPALINKMLGGNFAAMESLGDAVMRPFLQVRPPP
jgi:hypothetical protein